MPSRSSCLHVLASCLQQGRTIGQATTDYSPVSDIQAAFLSTHFGPATADLPSFADGEFSTLAAWDAETINDFLAANGFQITLAPFNDPDDFGVAAIMNVLVEWAHKGTDTRQSIDGVEYDMARLDEGVTTTRTNDGTTIAHVQCNGGKNTMHICLPPAGTPAPGDLEPLDLANLIQQMASTPSRGYEGSVIFPHVDLDHEVDVSWFKGINFEGTGRTGRTGRYKVLEAKQQTKFRMNSKGARAESAAAMTFGLECFVMPPPPVLIDKPFLIWLTREGQTLPYFAGYIDRDAWRSPAAL